MKCSCYLVLALLAFAPALAQNLDSVLVEVSDASYPAYEAEFGPGFPCDFEGGPLGPLPLAAAEPVTACAPLENPDEVEGGIALIERGGCNFAAKVLAAQATGADAVLVYNDDRVPDDDESLTVMSGDCPDCAIPAAFVSRNSGLALLDGVQGGTEATITPFCADPPPPTSADPAPAVASRAFTLGAPYPNPSDGSVTVPLTSSAVAEIRVAVYDALGREVVVLHEGALSANIHRFTLDGVRLPLGVYLIRATGDGFEATQRLTITR